MKRIETKEEWYMEALKEARHSCRKKANNPFATFDTDFYREKANVFWYLLQLFRQGKLKVVEVEG